MRFLLKLCETMDIVLLFLIVMLWRNYLALLGSFGWILRFPKKQSCFTKWYPDIASIECIQLYKVYSFLRIFFRI
jgi:hypothetical protein